jgi:hypothetical protein
MPGYLVYSKADRFLLQHLLQRERATASIMPLTLAASHNQSSAALLCRSVRTARQCDMHFQVSKYRQDN